MCPICRDQLPEEIVSSVNTSDLEDNIDSDLKHVKYKPSAEIIEMQQTMLEIYHRQLLKGGIIDLEAERNKFLIPKVYCSTLN